MRPHHWKALQNSPKHVTAQSLLSLRSLVHHTSLKHMQIVRVLDGVRWQHEACGNNLRVVYGVPKSVGTVPCCVVRLSDEPEGVNNGLLR